MDNGSNGEGVSGGGVVAGEARARGLVQGNVLSEVVDRRDDQRAVVDAEAADAGPAVVVRLANGLVGVARVQDEAAPRVLEAGQGLEAV